MKRTIQLNQITLLLAALALGVLAVPALTQSEVISTITTSTLSGVVPPALAVVCMLALAALGRSRKGATR